MTGLGNPRNHPGIGAKLLWALKTIDIADLIVDGQSQNLAHAGDRLKQIEQRLLGHSGQNHLLKILDLSAVKTDSLKLQLTTAPSSRMLKVVDNLRLTQPFDLTPGVTKKTVLE
jgi:hypothetical protein